MNLIRSQRGFTLIEIMVVMVVLGIMALMGSFGLSGPLTATILPGKTAKYPKKHKMPWIAWPSNCRNIPLQRSIRSRYDISAGTAGSLTYTATFGGANEVHTFSQVGDQLRLDNQPLADLVIGNGLQFTYLNAGGTTLGGGTDLALRIIQISLSLRGPNVNVTRTFTTRVALQS